MSVLIGRCVISDELCDVLQCQMCCTVIVAGVIIRLFDWARFCLRVAAMFTLQVGAKPDLTYRGSTASFARTFAAFSPVTCNLHYRITILPSPTTLI